MDTLTIRRTTLADLAAVDALFASSYARLLARDYPPSVVVTALPILARAQPHLLASGRYYVAEDADGRILGAGGWSGARFGWSAGRAEVRHLVTDWRMTRRGIASALMAHVFAEARRAGAVGMGCLATRTAVPFYLSAGFRPVGPVSVPLRPGIDFPAVRMDRAL
ncbi:MAG: GNAT family N-acetyltransferase [Pseudomonadota bacterium]